MIASGEQLQTPVESIPDRHLQRPSFRWSDLWNAPLNDFPIRDEILYQFLPLGPALDVLEIGPGSGFTTFRLSRRVRHVTVADATEEPIADLRTKFRNRPNVRCICADIGAPGLPAVLRQQYDVAFGLDVFEYVTDPRRAFANLAEVLRPGGELFLSYPNMPPAVGDGVTYFERSEQLERLLEEAGFHRWTISAIRLKPYAARIYRLFHELPLRIYRRWRGSDPAGKPQTFDRAWSFQNRRSLDRYKAAVHFGWLILGKMLRLRGNVFASRPISGNIYRNQLVIRAWK